MSNHNFSKSDRLKSKQQIQQLFESGNSFIEFPIKVIWKSFEDKESLVQIALSIPKKNLPKAVHRSKLKRLIKESYRQQNQELKSIISDKGKHLQMIFIFLDKQLWNFSDLDNKISVTLKRLQKKL